jgi:enoyl-CoA hydratase
VRPIARWTQLILDRRDGIAVVRLAPVWTGHLHPSFFAELRDVLATSEEDSTVQAVVIRGDTDVFFGGLPREWAAALDSAPAPVVAAEMVAARRLLEQLLSFEKPLIAAVNGPSVSIGNQIALLCDDVVAADTASFTDPHLQKGLTAGDGGTTMWPALVGVALARDILLRGRTITAEHALALELVGVVTSRDDVERVAIERARAAAKVPRVAYVATKSAINAQFRSSFASSLDAAIAYETLDLVVRSTSVPPSLSPVPTAD